MKQTLTRDDTKMIQGLSVLAMVVLHLFDKLDYQGLYQPLLYFAGKPIVFYFAQLSDFCVMGFAFCSGYALYKQFCKSEIKVYYKRRIKSLLVLLANYWMILFIFTAISVLMGNGKNMPKTAGEFIGNFLTVNTTYNGAWWYLFIYIILVTASPIIFKLYNKLPAWFSLIISFGIYCSAYYVRFFMTDNNWILTKYGVLGMTYFEFLIGTMVCKNQLFDKIESFVTKKIPKWAQITIAFVTIILLLIGHTLIVPSLFIAPFTGSIIILIFLILKKPNWIKKLFLFLGKHSTNIWLIHMFFYMYIFKDFVYVARYPLAILMLMLVICIVCSYIINMLLLPVNKKIMKWIK